MESEDISQKEDLIYSTMTSLLMGKSLDDNDVDQDDICNTYNRRISTVSNIERKDTQFENVMIRFKYANIIYNYKRFISYVTELVKELSVNNNFLSYSIIISELIKEGLLSNNLKFLIVGEFEQFKDVPNYGGLDVINGYGCCRHVTDIYRRIFKVLGINGQSINCFVDKEVLSLKTVLHRDVNHYANLCEYNNVLYTYDVLSMTFYEFINSFTMRSIIPTNIDYLYHKPILDYEDNFYTRKGLMQLLKRIEEDSKKPHLSFKEIEEIVKETNQIIVSKRPICNDYVKEIKQYIKRIPLDKISNKKGEIDEEFKNI